MTAATLSPTLAGAMRRYAAARLAARAVIDGIDEAAFHRKPSPRGWSVGQCLDHLVVSGGKILDRLEPAIGQARAEGRLASAKAAAEPVRFGWFDRMFIAGTAPGKAGAAPRVKVATKDPFDPGEPAENGRTREGILADFLALQDRLDDAARAADGLDLKRIKVASVIAAWAKVSLGGWFIAIAGHQERHLDQARRARAAARMTGAFGEATGAGGP